MGEEGGAARPLLFLDVDGPLIPFGGPAPNYSVEHGDQAIAVNPLLTRIDPGAGRRLAVLGYELVWATTWGEDANECIAPLIGLPPLPVVSWPEASAVEERDARAGRHWKTRALVTEAAGRAFAGSMTRSRPRIASGWLVIMTVRRCCTGWIHVSA